MKVKVIVPFALHENGEWRAYTTDDIADIDAAEAKRLIEAGFAAPASGKAAPVIETGELLEAETAEAPKARHKKAAD